MILVIASGKGGTGKTTVAVNLSLVLENVQLLDADVEEPNVNMFLHADFQNTQEVTVSIPDVDEEVCSYCGACARFCAYHAIAVVRKQVLLFPELCHACKGCELVCPVDAIGWKTRTVGWVKKATTEDGIYLVEGELAVGEMMAVPVIKQVKKEMNRDKTVIIDAPPGTSCPVMESMKGADYVILVTEPTPFGLHDLRLSVEVVRKMGLCFGVVINRDGIGDAGVDLFCQKEDIPVLLRIPHDARIAFHYSNGEAFVKEMPEMNQGFLQLFKRIQEKVA